MYTIHGHMYAVVKQPKKMLIKPYFCICAGENILKGVKNKLNIHLAVIKEQLLLLLIHICEVYNISQKGMI